MAVIWLLQICMLVYIVFVFFFHFGRDRESINSNHALVSKVLELTINPQ